MVDWMDVSVWCMIFGCVFMSDKSASGHQSWTMMPTIVDMETDKWKQFLSMSVKTRVSRASHIVGQSETTPRNWPAVFYQYLEAIDGYRML